MSILATFRLGGSIPFALTFRVSPTATSGTFRHRYLNSAFRRCVSERHTVGTMVNADCSCLRGSNSYEPLVPALPFRPSAPRVVRTLLLDSQRGESRSGNMRRRTPAQWEPQTNLSELANRVARASLPLETPADLDALLNRIGQARYVLLGEASHGTSEYYQWRAWISQRLIREKGFSFIAVEGDWPDCYRLNRYIKGFADAGGERARRWRHSCVGRPGCGPMKKSSISPSGSAVITPIGSSLIKSDSSGSMFTACGTRFTPCWGTYVMRTRRCCEPLIALSCVFNHTAKTFNNTRGPQLLYRRLARTRSWSYSPSCERRDLKLTLMDKSRSSRRNKTR